MLKFNTTKSEMATIVAIVNLAEQLGIVDKSGRGKRVNYSRMTCDMDLTACHCNGNPLDLARLLAADDFNFSHDVCGIARHINRETGQLENCFVPRFSTRQSVTA